MKVGILALLLFVFVGLSYAQFPVHLHGYTYKEYPWVPFVDVNVKAQSYDGDSPIVQSYWSGEQTQYHIPGSDLVYGRTYYRVYAWKGEAWSGTNNNSFTWWNNEVIQRDVTLFATGK